MSKLFSIYFSYFCILVVNLFEVPY